MHASHRVSEPDVPNAHRARYGRGAEWIHMYIRVIKAPQTCNSSGPSLVPAGRSSPGMGGVKGTHTKPHVHHDMCSKDLNANYILAQGVKQKGANWGVAWVAALPVTNTWNTVPFNRYPGQGSICSHYYYHQLSSLLLLLLLLLLLPSWL